MKMLPNEFFNRDAAIVAKDLLGKVLRAKYQNTWLSAMIIETEAYYLHEKGSHASLGYTDKRKALFMPAGTIYMYHARGGDSLNTSCAGAGNAVLFKSGIPYIDQHTPQDMLHLMHQLNPKKNRKRHDNKLCSGQTLLCKSLGLKVKIWDQKNFDHEKIFIEDIGYQPNKIIQTKRLGIPPGRDEHLMLRFIDYDFAPYATSNPLTKKKYQHSKDYKILNVPSLKNLQILLLRPKQQAQNLAKNIRTAGGKPILFPTLIIKEPQDKLSLPNTLKHLQNIKIAIFTSANAVLKMIPYFKKFPKNIAIIATGPATAKSLAPHFQKIIIPASPFTSEMILKLPQLQHLAKQNIAIFTGEDGRNVLAETLKNRGAIIHQTMVYRRACPKIKTANLKWQPKNIDIIVGTSFAALQNLLELLNDKKSQLLKKTLLVGSDRLLKLAKKLGFQKIILAENATDEAIFKALKTWYSSRSPRPE